MRNDKDRLAARVMVVLAASAAVAMLTGCRISQATPLMSSAPPGPSLRGTTVESWHVSLHVSGGFAGVNRELDLASTGVLTARDRKRGADVTARAPADDLVQIGALVADVKSVDSGRPTACRDCLQYDIEVRAQGQTLAGHLDDTTLTGSRTEALVKALTNLLERALAGRLE